jgi:hypothetical protein
MLTPAEITTGTARLSSGKLSPVDIENLVSAFDMTFAGLDLDHDYHTDLAELDDDSDPAKKAAQIAAVITKLEDMGFTGALMSGGKSALTYSEKEEYLRLVLFAFSKLYTIPKEFSIFDMRRGRYFGSTRVSSTVHSVRVE